jgi:lysozyme
MGTAKIIDIASGLCREFEGFSAKPYICPAGYATIGWGSTRYSDGRLVRMGDAHITKAQADELLHRDLLTFYASVVQLCPGLLGRVGASAAVLDFTYNLGPARLKASTLRRRINEGNLDAARSELGRWIFGGGRVLPGLVRRRAAEAKLF